MNNVKAIQKLNEVEKRLGVKSSWHDEYKDSAYIFIGGLDYEMTEGDVLSVFSQYVM
jgi:RNA-binding motif X-linked protein 2